MVNQCKKLSSYQDFARGPSRKPKENFVERMLKINIDVIKYENSNATTRLMISQNFGEFRKIENFLGKYRFFRISFFKEIIGRLYEACVE